MNFNKENFYPTPISLLDKIFIGVDWKNVNSILEPSAGKGTICDYIKENARVGNNTYSCYHETEIDCIELDTELRCLLKGKDYPVVHDDFLTFETMKKYDLIVMNPPFIDGDKHLLKALQMQKNGGNILCILNAETIRNPYSNIRKDLVKRLDELNAIIEFHQETFLEPDSERKTNVEVAVVKVFIATREQNSILLDNLKKKYYPDSKVEDFTEIAENDYLKALVQRYRLEEEMGITLIREYNKMKPFFLDKLKNTTYASNILELKIKGKELTENNFLFKIREKYWRALFADQRFTGKMTSQLREEYNSKVSALSNYDFSFFNIKSIQEEFTRNLAVGIEECIYFLFENLTNRFAQYDGCSNVHYYNGWKTNKAWIINKKVILPSYAYDYIFKKLRISGYKVVEIIQDIEKALSYLDGQIMNGAQIANALRFAEENNITKNIQCQYFNLTFYKKGTVHITFTDEELLKKLNIYGSQKKGWLPPAYGKKSYQDMTADEKAVINEFEGEKSYKEVFANRDYYLTDTNSFLLSMGELA